MKLTFLSIACTLICVNIPKTTPTIPQDTTSISSVNANIAKFASKDSKSELVTNPHLNRILKIMIDLDGQVKKLEKRVVTSKSETLSEITNILIRSKKVQLRFIELLEYIDDIDYAFSYIQDYISHRNIDPATLDEFARFVTSRSSSSSIKLMVEWIYRAMMPERESADHSKLIEVVADVGKLDNDLICTSKQSSNQLLYNVYNVISITLIKGNAMIEFAHAFMALHAKNTKTVAESQTTKQNNFSSNILEFTKEIRKYMDKASTHYWRCDPDQYQKNENYLEITGLIQGYIENEIDLNAQRVCRKECSDYQFSKSYSCSKNSLCSQQTRCKGSVINCKAMDSNIQVCLSPPNTDRRYEYVEYKNGTTMGRKEHCTAGLTADTWRHWFWTCSFCMCLCDEETATSDRYFSLLPAVSNVTDNKVVTGLRFVKKNRIVHLQIQQGKLLKYGVIDENTIEWVPVSDMKLSPKHNDNRQNYYTLDWQNRAIDLDDLQGDNKKLPNARGYVLTGVQFQVIDLHLKLHIQVIPFDFKTGLLAVPMNPNPWIYNQATEFLPNNTRTEYVLNNVDVPTEATAPNTIKSTHNQYIQFTHTDFHKDVAQTTVPFLDSQPVVPGIPVPLGGAGLYYKSAGDSGGFIGLKVLTYNFGKQLDL